MSEAQHYPRADVTARFRRPKALQIPSDKHETLRLRLEWDEPVHVEELLELEIPLADGSQCACTARVARVDPIVWKEPTRYEVFLELFGVDDVERALLCELLEEEAPKIEAPVGGTSRYVMQGPFHEGTSFRRPRREELAKI